MTEIIVAGGTFEKDYFDDGSVGFYRGDEPTAVDDILRVARIDQALVTTVMLIDSLEMKDAHRRGLVEACRASESDLLVVVHGTDTLVETAKHIQRADLEKTIAVTGAMRPYRFGESDATANLIYALATAQHLPNGTYVTMHGATFDPQNVQKNTKLGRFEKIS